METHQVSFGFGIPLWRREEDSPPPPPPPPPASSSRSIEIGNTAPSHAEDVEGYARSRGDSDSDSRRHFVTLFLVHGFRDRSEILRGMRERTLPTSCVCTDASRIADKIVLLSAIATAFLHQESPNLMKTKTLETEVMYCLNPTRNVGASFELFGIRPETKVLLVALIDASCDECSALLSFLGGEIIPIVEHSSFIDQGVIESIYKVEEDELITSSLVDLVLSKMTIRDVSK